MKALIKRGVKNFCGIVYLIVVGAMLLAGCKDNATNPFSSRDYLLCYCAYGQIKINNILGSNPQIISKDLVSGQYDDYPQWSPNGRYIAYQSLIPGAGNPYVYVYDTQNKMYTNLTSDGGIASSNPQWAPNGKVYFSYERPILSPTATYMMNPDGSDKRKILDDSAAIIYFYQDSYTFLFFSGDGDQVHKTNIDGTLNEFICDLHQILNQYVAIQGFNPSTQELLFTYISSEDSSSRIATFNVETKNINNLLTGEHGYTFFQLQYSSDCSKIALIEHSNTDEYLSILENDTKRRFVYISNDTTGGYKQFSWFPPKFSGDNRYIAYDELVYGSGSWINFQQYLFVIDINSGNTQYIDKGFSVSWSPQL